MARKPKQQRSRATVDAIVKAALIAVSRQGPADTTTRQVADIAGIGVGSLYEYFENKEAIFSAAADHFATETVAVIQPMVPELVKLPVRDAIRELLYAIRDFLEEENQLYLKCARHAFSVKMNVYQSPINRVLMDFFTQYLMHHPDLLKLPNIPATAYFYINGGIFTVIQHLCEDQPTHSFEELTTVLGDLLGSYVEHKLTPTPEGAPS